MSRQIRNGLGFLLTLAVGSCASEQGGPTEPEGPVPTAGTLSLQLSTPNANDGGVMFTISGGTINSVSSSNYTIFTAQPGPTIRKVVVAGNLTNGVLVTIAVPDVALAGQYTAVLEQVAARDTYAQQDLSGYTLQVVP
jgi:hypothetical protein